MAEGRVVPWLDEKRKTCPRSSSPKPRLRRIARPPPGELSVGVRHAVEGGRTLPRLGPLGVGHREPLRAGRGIPRPAKGRQRQTAEHRQIHMHGFGDAASTRSVRQVAVSVKLCQTCGQRAVLGRFGIEESPVPGAGNRIVHRRILRPGIPAGGPLVRRPLEKTVHQAPANHLGGSVRRPLRQAVGVNVRHNGARRRQPCAQVVQRHLPHGTPACDGECRRFAGDLTSRGQSPAGSNEHLRPPNNTFLP